MSSILPERLEPRDPVSKEEFISQQPRLFRFAHRAGELWRNRPSALEVHFYYLPMALMAGSLAVSMADETFHLRLAHAMAEVRVDQHDGFIERTFEHAVHEVGVEAQKAENN